MHEYIDEMDDFTEPEMDDEEWEKFDNPPQEQLDHAQSLVGKYCSTQKETISTPFLSNLLCKVVKVNDNRRGGNREQVLVRVYRNKQTWAFKTWWWTGTGREVLQCVSSSHLVETTEHPTIKDIIISSLSICTRIITESLSTEKSSFKYGWWHDRYMWQYITPFSSFLASLCDFGRAFKKGVIF